MFSPLNKFYDNTDHIVLQISSTNFENVLITKDGNKVSKNHNYSLIVSGGFDPGLYTIKSNNEYVQYFIFDTNGLLIKDTVRTETTIKLDRYRYEIIYG